MPPQIDAKKNFLVCNAIVAALFIIGNLTLPSVSLVYSRTPPTKFWFLNGIVVSEVVIVGVYASFCPVFYVVRWAWSILASVVCALLFYIGIYIAESWSYHNTDLLFLIMAFALVGNLATIGVSTCVRWFTGLKLTLDANAEEKPATKNFNLMFLFQLTFAITLLLLFFKTFTMHIPKDWDLRIVMVIVCHSALHILFCTGLTVCSLIFATTSRNRKTGFALLGALIVLGTLPLVLVCQMLMGTSYSFFRWWLETQSFFLGFTCSLMVVFSLWRWAGLQFVRANATSGYVQLDELGS